METELTQMILGIVATVATIGLAYLKKTLGKKGESEEQVDVILDFVESFAEELEKKYPGVKDLEAFRKHLKKLRKMWDREEVTTDDILDYLEELEG